MLYVYAAMFLSSLLCLTGIIISFINLQKYNFGLYIALLSTVTFSIALAFYVIKPKACLGPRWFSRLIRKPLTTSRSGQGGSFGGENGDTETAARRRLIFFGFNTTALFNSQLDTDMVDRMEQLRQTARQAGCELERNTAIMDEPPSTTLIPPTPPSLGDEEDENEKNSDESRTRVRAWTLLNSKGDPKEEGRRVRAWTFTCSSTMKQDKQAKRVNSAQCWRQWQEFLMSAKAPALMLQSSFPLTERLPRERVDSGSSRTSSQPHSWSTEEVVDLNEYLGPSSPRKTRSGDKQCARKVSSSHSDKTEKSSVASEKPSRKNALSPMDDPYSWHRSHTITVKYVPIRQEWIPKPLAVRMDAGLYRKKSRSTNAMLTIINSKEGSPWWSLSNLFQRTNGGTQQKREGANEEMV